MVSRKNLNVPAFKIGNVPIFWFKEITSKWWCSICKTESEKSVSLQVSAKLNKDKITNYYLCMHCAERMCDEVLTEATITRKGGVEALKLSRDL